MNGLLLGVGFLTRFPVPSAAPAPGDWGLAARAFPLAGAVVALVAVAGQVVGTLVWGPLVGAVLAVAGAAWITGALHLDGVSDCLDGMYCNGDREKTLLVMRDPRVGAVGAIGTALLLALKIAFVVACSDVGTGGAALWIAMIGARTFLPFEMALGAPATPGRGLFAHLATEVRPRDGVFGVLVAAALVTPAVVVVPAALGGLAVGMGAAAWVTLAWSAAWRRRIGGLTGDVLGAAVELREVVLLAALGAGALA